MPTAAAATTTVLAVVKTCLCRRVEDSDTILVPRAIAVVGIGGENAETTTTAAGGTAAIFVVVTTIATHNISLNSCGPRCSLSICPRPLLRLVEKELIVVLICNIVVEALIAPSHSPKQILLV